MKTNSKRIPLITLLSLMSLFLVTTVFAISNTIGGVSVTAVQTVTTDWDNWTATIYSTAASNIGTIGWSGAMQRLGAIHVVLVLHTTTTVKYSQILLEFNQIVWVEPIDLDLKDNTILSIQL